MVKFETNPQIVSPHRRRTWRRAASTPRTTTTNTTTSTRCTPETSTAVCSPKWRRRRRSRRSCRSCCSTRPRSSSSSAPSASLPSSSWSPSSSTPPSPPSSCSSTLGQPSVSPSTLSPGEVNNRHPSPNSFVRSVIAFVVSLHVKNPLFYHNFSLGGHFFLLSLGWLRSFRSIGLELWVSTILKLFQRIGFCVWFAQVGIV